jgi:uncharacterized protein YecT (DUF1311 family)
MLRDASIFFVLWFSSSIVLSGAANNGTQTVGPDCDLSSGGQQQMNVCSGAKYQAADKQMNDLYQQLIKRLSKDSGNKLRASQRAWLKYRDTAFTYEVEWNGPCQGTICPYEANTVMTELTEQRIERLQNYVNCTDNGCPL